MCGAVPLDRSDDQSNGGPRRISRYYTDLMTSPIKRPAKLARCSGARDPDAPTITTVSAVKITNAGRTIASFEGFSL